MPLHAIVLPLWTFRYSKHNNRKLTFSELVVHFFCLFGSNVMRLLISILTLYKNLEADSSYHSANGKHVLANVSTKSAENDSKEEPHSKHIWEERRN